MLWTDANSIYWKTKFIDGLTSLFAERVKHRLQGSNGNIDYDSYTYGQLNAAIISEDLKLCNDLNYKNR